MESIFTANHRREPQCRFAFEHIYRRYCSGHHEDDNLCRDNEFPCSHRGCSKWPKTTRRESHIRVPVTEYSTVPYRILSLWNLSYVRLFENIRHRTWHHWRNIFQLMVSSPLRKWPHTHSAASHFDPFLANTSVKLISSTWMCFIILSELIIISSCKYFSVKEAENFPKGFKFETE